MSKTSRKMTSGAGDNRWQLTGWQLTAVVRGLSFVCLNLTAGLVLAETSLAETSLTSPQPYHQITNNVTNDAANNVTHNAITDASSASAESINAAASNPELLTEAKIPAAQVRQTGIADSGTAVLAKSTTADTTDTTANLNSAADTTVTDNAAAPVNATSAAPTAPTAENQSTSAAPAENSDASSAPKSASADSVSKDAVASSGNADTIDPMESFNRKMYRVNEVLDKALRPVAVAYDSYVPLPARVSFSNFTGNLGDPVVALNNTLQAKPKNSLSDLARFVINSTLGIFGLFDVASEIPLKKNDEDFGQTLAVWGVNEGPYLYLPILGPKTLRDALAFPIDWWTRPNGYLLPSKADLPVTVTSVVDKRAGLLSLESVLDNATDKYSYIRAAYLQSRRAAVADGAKPATKSESKSESDDFYDPSTDGSQASESK